jgi:hypothetical protein
MGVRSVRDFPLQTLDAADTIDGRERLVERALLR